MFLFYRNGYIRTSLSLPRQGCRRVLGHENPVHGWRHPLEASRPRHEREEHPCGDQPPLHSQFVSCYKLFYVGATCMAEFPTAGNADLLPACYSKHKLTLLTRVWAVKKWNHVMGYLRLRLTRPQISIYRVIIAV